MTNALTMDRIVHYHNVKLEVVMSVVLVTVMDYHGMMMKIAVLRYVVMDLLEAESSVMMEI